MSRDTLHATDTLAQQGPGTTVAALLRDRWVQAAGLIIALSTLPYWLFSPGQAHMEQYGDNYAELPTILLVLVALAFRASRSSTPRERGFWRLWTLAIGLWAFAMASAAVIPVEIYTRIRFYLAEDVLYTAFYLCLAMSIELHPVHPGESIDRRLKAFETAGTLLVLFGAVFYFVVLPYHFNAGDDTYAPFLQMYVLMDAYIVLRLVLLGWTTRDPVQRSVSGLLAGAMAWCTMTDLYELLSWREKIVTIESGTFFDFVWAVPYLLILLAARWGAAHKMESRVLDDAPRRSLKPIRAGLLVMYAVAFPFLHTLLYSFELLHPASREPRLLTSILLMLVLAGLAITYQRLLDNDRHRLETERHLDAENRNAGRRMEALGRLAGGVAHDFNNMLTVIRGANDIVRSTTQANAPSAEWLDEIEAASQRARLLTQQLLAFSRHERNRPKTFSVSRVLADVDAPMTAVLGANRSFKVTGNLAETFLYADKAQVERVLLNLGSNASDAMPLDGEFRLDITSRTLAQEEGLPLGLRAGDYVVIAAIDTGAGIDPEALPQIFEPFFSTQSGLGDSGLGLSTCYGIVRQLGGTMTAENLAEGGRRFSVLLPAVEAPLDDVEPSDETSPSQSARQSLKETILVAEDEMAIRKLMTHMLSESGYSILEAASGEEALEIADNFDSHIDLLLTDVVMPGMTGPELAKRVHDVRPETRIAYCSGNPQAHLQKAGEPWVEAPFLRKPFDRRTLAAFVRQVMSPPN